MNETGVHTILLQPLVLLIQAVEKFFSTLFSTLPTITS